MYQLKTCNHMITGQQRRFLQGEAFNYMSQVFVKIQIANIIKAINKALSWKYHDYKLPTQRQSHASYDWIACDKQPK